MQQHGGRKLLWLMCRCEHKLTRTYFKREINILKHGHTVRLIKHDSHTFVSKSSAKIVVLNNMQEYFLYLSQEETTNRQETILKL